MKTKMTYLAIFAVLCGCRNEFIDLTREEYGVVTQIMIRPDFPEGDGSIAVPKGDQSNTANYKLRAYVYNHDGMPLYRPIDWRVSDPALVELMPETDDPPTHEARAAIRTLQDVFDAEGETEPEATITACVTNDCEGYGGEVVCEPEICSAPITVKGVVNAEGAWELSGATFPFTVAIYTSQTGRTLDAISSYYEPEIHGNQINFSAGSTSYVGHFTDRTRVTGEAIVSPSGDNLGTWTAVKCPDTGCTGAGP